MCDRGGRPVRCAQGVLSSSPYIYPPPLMGRLDDPFFGLVPPIVSFPPWWRRNDSALVEPRATRQSARRLHPAAPSDGSAQPGAAPGGPPPAEAAARHRTSGDPRQPVGSGLPARGRRQRRGRREIEETARSVPGVTRVESQFQVQPRRAEGEMPPPPPEPMLAPTATEPAARPAPPPARSPKLNPDDRSPDRRRLQRTHRTRGRRARAAADGRGAASQGARRAMAWSRSQARYPLPTRP